MAQLVEEPDLACEMEEGKFFPCNETSVDTCQDASKEHGSKSTACNPKTLTGTKQEDTPFNQTI